MKKEVISAVNFLVDLLRVNNNNPLLTEDQLIKFRKNVYECLWIHYKDHWFPDKPLKGSGYRCIRINGNMDPLIKKAGQLMGIASEALRRLFPSELTMWVDPREVAYRIGENGSICQLYVQKSKVNAVTESVEEAISPPQQQQQQSPQKTLQSTIQHIKQQQQQQQLQKQFSSVTPSKSPPPVQSPVRRTSPIFTNNNHQLRVQQQQLAMILMNGPNTINCKDSLRSANLESVRGMDQRLYVSS